MKTGLAFLFLLVFSIPVFAKSIIVFTVKDKNGLVTGYHVIYNTNPDGSEKIVDYALTDDLTKILPVISKQGTGLSKDDDRTTIWLNADDTVNRVDHWVNTVDKSETPQQKIKQDDGTTVVADLKAELDVKQQVVPK